MAQYALIQRTEYNNIQQAVYQVLGPTTAQGTFGATGDDYGYGQTMLSSQVPANTTVTAEHWNNLTKDVLRCLYHQNGTDLTNIFASSGNVNNSAVVSGYPYSTTVNTVATATSAITNYVTVTSTSNMTFGMSVVFTGTSFGNLVSGQPYYILQVVNATSLLISQSNPASGASPAFVLSTASGSMTAVATGSKGQYILDADRATLFAYTTTGPGSNASNIDGNRLVTPPSGFGVTYPQGVLYQYAVAGQLPAILQGSVTAWSGTKSHTVTVTFASHNAARYYFNSGGNFSFKVTMSNIGSPGQPSYSLNYTWSTMFTAMDTFVFSARSCGITGTAQTSGSGTTYTKLNGGFYNLTTAPSTVLTLFAPSGTYSANQYLINAWYDGGGTLYFTIIFSDAYSAPGPWGITEKVTADLSSIVSTYYASGQDVDGNNTVVVTRPPATSTPL